MSKPSKADIDAAAAAIADADEADKSKAALAKQRVETERKRNEILDIELAQRRGEVVLIDDVVLALATTIGEINTRLLSLPARVAARVARMDKPADIKKLLAGDVKRMMDDLRSLDAATLAGNALAEQGKADGRRRVRARR